MVWIGGGVVREVGDGWEIEGRRSFVQAFRREVVAVVSVVMKVRV